MSAEKKPSATPNLDRAWSDAKKRANAAYDARDALAMLRAETEADIAWAQRDLFNDLHRLAQRLAFLADAIEADPTYNVSSLGEVQSSGTSIDLRCATIARMRQTLREIEGARKAAAEKEGA
jgi:hypothetical protein